MLQILSCSRPEDKRALFTDFDPQGHTWVVSDLQSKWHLQKVLLDKHKVLEEQAVKRATELWKHLAFQVIPDARILSNELAQTLFWNWIQPMNLPWARSPQAIPVLLNQMQMWMSIFADPQHEEIMAQWFDDNKESYVRWGHWFELCSLIWNRCQEQNLVMASWLPAVILSHDVSELQWPRAMTFDLGPQISQVEGVLLRELGKHFDVRVIYPEAPWVSLMKNALRPYADLLPTAYNGDPKWQPNVDESLEFGRFSTQLAEVKDCVGRVRAWMDSGIPAAKIAVVAPDIEHYWPVLQLYFKEEGLPVNKASTSRLGSFIEMAQWISTLRTLLSKISAHDLEVYFFSGVEQPRLAFDDFRVLFSHVYDSADLKRAKKLFESKLSPPSNEPQTIQDFLVWAMKFWNATAAQARLSSLLQVIGVEVPRELTLLPGQWLSYVEGLLARREVKLQPADENGVWCVSLSSADWLEISHAVFLNLSEGALRSSEISPVSAGEAQKIFNDTGFALGTTDRQEHEFELLWFLKRQWSALQLDFPVTDFQGSVQTPSRMWMWAGITNDKLKREPQLPRLTRWDEIQHQSLESLAGLREFAEAHHLSLKTGIERDVTGAVNTWKANGEVRISASSLEKFWDCPFIFGAQRKLKLSDDPALDLDLDRRTRGNLLHALVEELLCEPLRWDWSDVEIAGLVEKAREREGIRMGDERLWPAVSAQHVRLGRIFLDHEKKWRERFPNTKTVGRELAFECYWDTLNSMPQEVASPVVISGRLDRVDVDTQGRYSLIDYKATKTNLKNWQSWLSNRQIQLALYAQLLELGLMGLPQGAVASANYYVVRDSDRHFGFHVKDATSELYSSDDKHRNFIDAADKEELFKQLRMNIQDAITKIVAGNFNPAPLDSKDCPSCSWRTLCRAPHLN
ncbi:MAG: PD-(D/E)XK nuclease family protein [Bdellovibrionales bacterium]